ncbi:MAG: N(5)-(carboxyethyl)ornithine synthase [Thermoanaerobaculia bacterium]
MTQITGVVGTSRKENEHRLPIHPRHLERIPEACRPYLRFERGYGERFGLDASRLEDFCGGLLGRSELLASCDVVLLPKPLAADLEQMREGAVHWGWPHCVQQREIAQIAIDRRLTLIAWEAMFQWSASGARGVHVFHKNNELAGYSSVLHTLELLGLDGHYGPRRRVAVLGFGSVSRGAVYALAGRGFSDLTIYTQRPAHLVHDPMFGATHRQMRRAGNSMEAVHPDGTVRPLADELARAGVIVNGTLQDTDRPLMYLAEDEIPRLQPGCLIVDVSCDLGMGFSFARPTSFEEPTFRVGDAVYYAVDHTPTYLWDAATWEISEALLPDLPAVMAGPDGRAESETLARAIEIEQGVVKNPKILSFQHREAEYPHRVR